MPERAATTGETETPRGGMLCPVCGVGLVMTDKQGVEIDYCPKCRGIWLDRGEIEKIIERSLDLDNARPAPRAAPTPDPVPMAGYPPSQGWSGGGHGGHDGGGHGGHGGGGHGGHDGGYGRGYGGAPRRRSWLRDLFD